MKRRKTRRHLNGVYIPSMHRARERERKKEREREGGGTNEIKITCLDMHGMEFGFGRQASKRSFRIGYC